MRKNVGTWTTGRWRDRRSLVPGRPCNKLRRMSLHERVGLIILTTSAMMAEQQRHFHVSFSHRGTKHSLEALLTFCSRRLHCQSHSCRQCSTLENCYSLEHTTVIIIIMIIIARATFMVLTCYCKSSLLHRFYWEYRCQPSGPSQSKGTSSSPVKAANVHTHRHHSVYIHFLGSLSRI